MKLQADGKRLSPLSVRTGSVFAVHDDCPERGTMLCDDCPERNRGKWK